MGSEANSCEREFGHCVVTWKLKNYCFALCQEKYEVETPQFAVRGPQSQITNWKFVLENDWSDKKGTKTRCSGTYKPPPEFSKCASNSKKELNYGKLTLYLERSDSDSGQETVWVEWKVSCFVDSRQVAVVKSDNYFEKKYRRGLYLGILFDFEREFQCQDAMEFVCQMIIYDKTYSKKVDMSVDGDLFTLSEDLKFCFAQKKYCDLKLQFGEFYFYANSAILASRLRNFNFHDVFKKDDGVIQLPESYCQGMLCIVKYLYSDDFTDVVARPSFSLYDSIIFLNMKELEQYFAPEVQKIETKIDIQKLTYVWNISDFSKRDDYRLSSPLLSNSSMDTEWQIHLYPRGISGTEEYVAVSVENTEGQIDNGFFMECAVLKKGETLHPWKPFKRSPKETKMFEIKEFMNREELSNLLYNDLLKFGFKLRRCIGKEHTFLKDATSYPVTYYKVKSFEKLPTDLSLLRKDDKYTDVTLKVRNEEIKAHKCILSVRSLMLASMLEEKKEDCLILSDVEPEILKVLLDYMYYNHMGVSDFATLLDVYKAAEKFLISRLTEKCSRIFRNSLTLENVCDVLNLADDYRDCVLKEAALNFIRLNMVDVFKQQAWEGLKIKKPSLCRSLRDSLTLETVCDVLQLADDYGDHLLKESAMDFIWLNKVHVLKHELWEDLKIKKPTLCSEVEKFFEKKKEEIWNIINSPFDPRSLINSVEVRY